MKQGGVLINLCCFYKRAAAGFDFKADIFKVF
jgi:hypothetical protein